MLIKKKIDAEFIRADASQIIFDERDKSLTVRTRQLKKHERTEAPLFSLVFIRVVLF